MGTEEKYGAAVKVGYYFPLDGLLAILQNPKEDERAEKPYIMNGSWYDNPLELIKTIAEFVGAQYDLYGNLQREDEVMVAFVPPGEKKYRINKTLHIGPAAFGPDYRMDYVLENIDTLKDMKKKFEDIGVYVREPLIFLSWMADDKDAQTTTR